MLGRITTALGDTPERRGTSHDPIPSVASRPGLALALGATPAATAQTADGLTPAVEDICTKWGLSGQVNGLCKAYCEAMDCDDASPHRVAMSPGCFRRSPDQSDSPGAAPRRERAAPRPSPHDRVDPAGQTGESDES